MGMIIYCGCSYAFFFGKDEDMNKIDRLIRKAKRKIQNVCLVFMPFVVSDQETAEKVSRELDEFCKGKDYSATIIYGENELDDYAEGVKIDHIGGVI